MITKKQALEALTVLLRRRGSIQPELTPADWDALYLVRAYIEQAEPSGFVRVPVDALAWLFGEVGDFEPPSDQKLFRGKVPPFWWRAEFRRRAGLKAAPKEPQK